MLVAPERSVEAPDAALDVVDYDALLTKGALQKAMFNSASFSCIATDAKGVIQIFNVGAERMLGYAATEVVNKLTPADISDRRELIARAETLTIELGAEINPGFEALVYKASRGIEDIYELTYVRKDNARVPASVSVTALRDEADAIIGYLLIGTDNTARRQIEDERVKLEHTLRQKNVELEAASRMKSEFLANMSHELRTPLNAIIGFSEILGDGLIGDLSEKQRGFIGDIFSSGTHLLSLINDILDLSKVEAGKMLLDIESVEIASLFVNSLSIVREKAAARRIQLSMDAPSELGSIRADGRKVKQIVYNLLANAVKFTSERGKVTLRASRVSRSDVGKPTGSWAALSLPLAVSDFENFLEISVTDTGIGLSPDELSHLFKPFSQIDSGLSRKFEGTGLGLAMVKLLAELHLGTVAVESAVGEGSRFTVWLPMRGIENGERSRPKAPPLAAPAVSPGGDRTALVVEDDFKSAELVRLQLQAEGFKVVHAASAEAALVLAVQQPLALITLDIMLPNMDGWEFLARLKQIDALKKIPVVIISIVADSPKGYALGAAAVMQKPISRLELYDSLVGLGLLPLVQSQSLDVLIVDDDPSAVELIALRLEGLASKIIRTFGGAEAIASARRDLPDLIVLDLMMPVVSGFDVVDALQRDAATARIPILIVTSKLVAPEDRLRLNSYVTAIMEKADFDSERFATEVRRAMSGRSALV